MWEFVWGEIKTLLIRSLWAEVKFWNLGLRETGEDDLGIIFVWSTVGRKAMELRSRAEGCPFCLVVGRQSSVSKREVPYACELVHLSNLTQRQ